MITSHRRIVALDGLRGVAIMLVMAYHFEIYTWPLPWHHGAGLPAWTLIRTGWIGVDLFFVLSGFLITGILLDAKGTPGYFHTFYTRRILRIFPLYYASIVFAFLVVPFFVSSNALIPTPGSVWWLVTYLGNVLIGLRGWEAAPLLTRHFWTLAIEEQFYLLWPLMVFVAPARLVGRIAIGAVAFSTALRIVLRLADAPPIAVHVLTPARLDALAVGALLAVWVRDDRRLAQLTYWARRSVVLTGLLVVVLFAWRQKASHDDIVIGTIGHTCFALFFGAVIGLAITEGRASFVTRVMEQRWLQRLGQYSYGLYVFHLMVQVLLGEAGLSYAAILRFSGSLVAGQTIYCCVYFGATFVIAMLSWHGFERRLLALKDRFPYHTATPRPGTPSPQVELARAALE